MKLSGDAVLWGVVFIMGCVHIQARSQTRDEETHQLLRESQDGKNPSQSTKYSRQQKKRTDYATKEKFQEVVSILQAAIDKIQASMNTRVGDLEGRIHKDNCAENPCVNHGVCRSRLEGYDCLCKAGYGGANCEHGEGMQVSKTMTVNYGNKKGAWSAAIMCPAGSAARSFRIQLEDVLDDGEDDTAMNDIELRCTDLVSRKDVQNIRGGEGKWGSWKDWQDCPSGEFLTGFSMKVEAPTDDNTAVNGVTMTCSGGSTLTGPIGPWGTFGETALCPKGHAICGVNVRFELLSDSDDSALNDIILMCCAWW